MRDKLKFWWPETGRLTVKFKGNERAVVRFFPSFRAITETIRKRGVEPAYDDFSGGHQIPHERKNEVLCELSRDPGTHLGSGGRRTKEN